jgi:hypothetical protein
MAMFNTFVLCANESSIGLPLLCLRMFSCCCARAAFIRTQELFGFERVHVPAGQTVTVYLGAQGVRFTQVCPSSFDIFFATLGVI